MKVPKYSVWKQQCETISNNHLFSGISSTILAAKEDYDSDCNTTIDNVIYPKMNQTGLGTNHNTSA